jgi:hypothetical protein
LGNSQSVPEVPQRNVRHKHHRQAEVFGVIEPKPLKTNITGIVYGFELGSSHAIFPALSRGKHLQISFPGKPERSVDLDIGAGRKAVAFLKKCDKFWSCVQERDLMGKRSIVSFRGIYDRGKTMIDDLDPEAEALRQKLT